VLIAFVLPVVNAVPDSFVTGPYKVSFDLGLPQDAYSVTKNAPVIDETLGGEKRIEYSVMINNKTGLYRFMTIGIKHLNESNTGAVFTGEMIEEVLASKDSDDPRISGFSSDTRTIDGADGAVASMTLRLEQDNILDGYHAAYMPSFDYRKQTFVEVVSSYPWNEGTLQLLKTIHVELV
jgi:hypothetical protein